MRKAILGTASALALASPAVAADVPVTPYTGGPTYEREVPYEYYRSAPPVVVAQPAPVVVVRRPVIVAPPKASGIIIIMAWGERVAALHEEFERVVEAGSVGLALRRRSAKSLLMSLPNSGE